MMVWMNEKCKIVERSTVIVKCSRPDESGKLSPIGKIVPVIDVRDHHRAAQIAGEEQHCPASYTAED